VTRVETVAGGRMVVHEDGTSFDVPLTADWTTAEPALAASAARQTDGRLVADVVFLATPHRVEIELDPAAGTFAARWLGVPLFGAGVDKRLASMQAPPD
jgi:hypothetical protein